MENPGPHASPVQDFQHQDHGIWPNGPVQLARGRQARDPQAKTITYNVASLDEFETSLREYLTSPPEQPEHTECQLAFWIGASFLVSAPPLNGSAHPQEQQQQQQQQHHHHHHHHQQQHQQQQLPPQTQPHLSQLPQAPPGYQPADGIHAAQYGAPSHTYQSVSDPAIVLTLPTFPQSSIANGASNNNTARKEHKISMSILEALAPTSDPKEKMRKQRAIAKCCVDSIQKVDGYRYSFHNCWNSREDDSFRFSYYCNDSLLNKDRAANGKGAKLGKRATKPVYDCKGVLSVKFSYSKQSLDVFYKHVPIHKTYEERAPPPRKDSKRRKFLEENDPEALIRIANRPKPPKPPEERVDPSVPPKPKKKKPKREDDHKTATNSIESDLRAQSLRSLLELIQTDPPAASEPTPLEPPPPPMQQTSSVGHQEPSPQQPQVQPSQTRKRPRNTCDVCKAKKTKCDGTRPVCQTCIDKKRQCLYSDMSGGEDRRQSMPEANETVRQAQAANNELSELEKMKRALEEAKARIQELEAEKTRSSSTASLTPQQPSRPQSISQPIPQPQVQPQVTPQPQRQRTQSHPQHSSQNQRTQAHQQPQPQPMPQQQQPMQAPQQLQTPQYSHFNNHSNHPSYGLNRPMSTQNAMPAQNTSHPSHAQTHHLQPDTTGLPTDASNPYGREFTWSAAYYGYQSAQQQQQDQWAAARNSGVFR